MKLAISAAALGALALLGGCTVETQPQYPAQPVTYVAPAPAYVVPAVPAAPVYAAPSSTVVVPPPQVYPSTPPTLSGAGGGENGGASKHSEARVK